MKRLAPLLALAILTGCGHATKPPPAPLPGAKLEARLRTHGYQVTAVPRGPRARFERELVVGHLDWATKHAFSVGVFLFASHAEAVANHTLAARSVGTLPATNHSRVVGPVVFVAYADTGGSLCTFVNGKLTCPKSLPIPTADFNRVVSVATG